MSLTCGFVKNALVGVAKVVATNFDGQKTIRRVSTDSRTINPGDLFVAYKGENFDGHEFISAAVKKGVEVVLCEKYPADAPQENITIFLVEDSLEAFRTLARHWREHLDPTVVAVAGSVGKTTTKDMLAALLSGKWESEKVLKTKGSQNGFLGLAITLMDIHADHEVAVIEVGIDAPGAMKQHINVVRPEIALVTAISEEHLEWLKDLPTIAHEENMILRETAQAGGTAVINLDDPWISPLMQEIHGHKKIGFTLNGVPGSQILSGKVVGDGDQLEVQGMGFKPFQLLLPLPGEHNARNLLGAVAVALAMGVKPDDLEDGIENFAPSGGRSQLEFTQSKIPVLCDFYNANPASMRAAFKVAADKMNAQGQLWLCLADMKELGTQEEALHRGLAKDIAKLGTHTHVLLYGDRMQWLQDELSKREFKGDVQKFANQIELAQHLKSKLGKDDFVLIKGSRSMAMEKVWETLKEG